MATASPNLREIAATTIKNYSRTLADNVSNGNAILAALTQRGRVRPADGGETILEELMYSENTNFSWYSAYDMWDVGFNETLSAAEYEWKQAVCPVTWNGLDVRIKNAGRERIHNLLESRIRVAELTMKNQITTAIYGDGTGSSAKEVTGLQAQVALDPTTGTVGGINRANFDFWRNQTSTNVANIDTSAVTLLNEMRTMWLECTRGSDQPNLIIADTTLFDRFWVSLTDIQRITQVDSGVTGFRSLGFNTAPVVFEPSSGTHSSGIRAATMYFLNTDYIFWRPHVSTNMVPLEDVEAINQDATVMPIVFAGNMTMSNASVQGVVFT